MHRALSANHIVSSFTAAVMNFAQQNTIILSEDSGKDLSTVVPVTPGQPSCDGIEEAESSLSVPSIRFCFLDKLPSPRQVPTPTGRHPV